MTNLDKYQKTFCKSFSEWYRKEWEPSNGTGAQTKLAKKLKVSQPYLSQILSGDKCFDSEEKRREIAVIIGLDYESMIGICQFDSVGETSPTYTSREELSEMERKTAIELISKLYEKIERLEAKIESLEQIQDPPRKGKGGHG